MTDLPTTGNLRADTGQALARGRGDGGRPVNHEADTELNRWFGMNVRAELRARGWSSRELSRRSGASPSTFTRTKSGQGVALAVAVRIAAALDVPLAGLVKPVTCQRCSGRPPAGFTCQACGKGDPDAMEAAP